MRNISIGEILLVNSRTRSATVFDETNNRILEIPLNPVGRDDDFQFNTVESLPKEGTRVQLGTYNNDVIITGLAPIQSLHRQVDELRANRKLTNVNEGDPLLNGLITDDLSGQDGYGNFGGELFGSYDPVYKKEEGDSFNFSGNSYDDVMPGDHVTSTKDGNAVAVLEGGVNIFKASDLCQIVGLKYNDLMRIVSRNFEHFSDFGNVIIRNNDGATSYVLEGSASQSESRMGRFTLRMEIGSAGDLYKISVLDGAGGVVSVFHMKGDGELVYYAQKEKKTIRGDIHEIIHGTKKVDVQGKVTNEFKDDYTTKVKGSEFRTVIGNQTLSVQQDRTMAVSRNLVENVGGTKSEDIFGTPIGTADKQRIFNGHKDEFITLMGDFIRFTTAGNFYRDTLIGDMKDKTIKGDMTRFTGVGDIVDTTVKGLIGRENLLGNIEDNAYLGDIKISAWSGGFDLYAGVPGAYNFIRLFQSGGIEIQDAYRNTITMSAGNIKVQEFTGATLNLQTSQVALGSQGIELLDLVDQVLEELDKNQLKLSTHIHFSPLGPTTPPQEAPDFVAVQVKLLIIKAKLNIIMGSL